MTFSELIMVILQRKLPVRALIILQKHKTEVIYYRNLFKLNKISHKDRLVNLGILLGSNNPDQNTTLPTNRGTLNTILQGNSSNMRVMIY